MEFQYEQILYFVSLGVLVCIAILTDYKWLRYAIILFILAVFFVNPFRMIATPIQRVMDAPTFSELPAKEGAKEYQTFDEWSNAQKDILKRQNEENIDEIHN